MDFHLCLRLGSTLQQTLQATTRSVLPLRNYPLLYIHVYKTVIRARFVLACMVHIVCNTVLFCLLIDRVWFVDLSHVSFLLHQPYVLKGIVSSTKVTKSSNVSRSHARSHCRLHTEQCVMLIIIYVQNYA